MLSSLVLAVALLQNPPDPSVALTKQQRVLRILEDMRALGAEIDPNTIDQTEGHLRVQLGQMTAAFVYIFVGDPRWAVVRNVGCDNLWEQWPWIAESYGPCEN